MPTCPSWSIKLPSRVNSWSPCNIGCVYAALVRVESIILAVKNLVLDGLYGRNGKPAKPSPKRQLSINDRTPRENYGRLSQTTSKVYRLHAPIPRLSSHRGFGSTNLATFVVRHRARRKRAGSRDQRSDIILCSPFLSIALAAHSCSELDKFYGLHSKQRCAARGYCTCLVYLCVCYNSSVNIVRFYIPSKVRTAFV